MKQDAKYNEAEYKNYFPSDTENIYKKIQLDNLLINWALWLDSYNNKMQDVMKEGGENYFLSEFKNFKRSQN